MRGVRDKVYTTIQIQILAHAPRCPHIYTAPAVTTPLTFGLFSASRRAARSRSTRKVVTGSLTGFAAKVSHALLLVVLR